MMHPFKCGLVCVLLLGGVCFWQPDALAQSEGVTIGVDESRRSAKSEPDPEGGGIAYSKVLRDTDPPYENVFRDVKVGARKDTKLGPGGAHFETHLFAGPTFNIPMIRRGGAPRNAEVKIGRFYLDARFLSASLLYSDNINLTSKNPKEGAIAIMRLGAVGIFQLTDNLYFSMAGTVIYLPFRGKIGIAGFGIDDALADLEAAPLARAQLAYNMEFAKWDVQVYDDFKISHRRIGADLDYDLFNGTGFDEEDRAGRYVFRDKTVLVPASGGARRNQDGTLSTSLIDVGNTLGFSAGRMLPTDTRMEFGANHSDHWYHGDHGFLPSSRDAVYASLQSERESLRFQPYASYHANKYDTDQGWNHSVRTGLAGPLTDYIDILGETGYHWSDNYQRSGTLWRARVRHTLGPLTYHDFEYRRTVTEPIRDLEESYKYSIRQVLGPFLYGEAYAARSHFEPLDNRDVGSLEDRVGIRLVANAGLRTTVRASITYTHIQLGLPTHDRQESVRPQLDISYKLAKDIQILLTYRYQYVSSSRPLSNYDENVVFLTVTKYF
jgi:hypothetical protein